VKFPQNLFGIANITGFVGCFGYHSSAGAFVASSDEVLQGSRKELEQSIEVGCLEYEVINALIIAPKRGRIGEEHLIAAIEGFVYLEIIVHKVANFYPEIIYFCRNYQRSAYDASYLALAQREDASFITADTKLCHTVQGDLNWVQGIGDVNL